MSVQHLNLTGHDWQLQVTPGASEAARFQTGSSRLDILPLQLGELLESYAVTDKLHPHISVDGRRQSVGMQVTLPFGAEPRLRREIAFGGNHAAVSSYIELKGNLQLRELNVDPLRLCGRWRRLAVIAIPEAGSTVPKPNWVELTEKTQPLYLSTRPFLICLAENQNGEIVEIGTGNDLWRWLAAENTAEATAEFSITADNNEIVINRKIFLFQQPMTMQNRPWRFKWYFAWNKPSGKAIVYPEAVDKFKLNSKFAAVKNRPTFFSMDGSVVEAAGAVLRAPGDQVAAYCFEAPLIYRRLRRFIRSAMQNCQHEELGFTGIEPHLCLAAEHLERPKKGQLLHWDMMKIMEFYDWASGQLAKHEIKFRIVPPPGAAAAQLPSMQGLSY